MTNLAQNLLDTAAKEPDATALRMDDVVLTYAEFRDAALQVAAGLQARGISPGDRVGMVLPNVAAFVPMNPLLKAREIEYYLTDSGARLVVAGDQSAQPAAEAAKEVGIESVS